MSEVNFSLRTAKAWMDVPIARKREMVKKEKGTETRDKAKEPEPLDVTTTKVGTVK